MTLKPPRPVDSWVQWPDSRAALCQALLDGRAWSAGELARHAGVRPSIAGEQFSRLIAGAAGRQVSATSLEAGLPDQVRELLHAGYER